MAEMKSDYLNGLITHTLTADRNEVISFVSDGRQVRLVFRNLERQLMTGYVHEDDLDDRTKYWKTSELIEQLKGLRDHYSRMRDHWKDKDSGLSLALKYSQRVGTIKEILDNMENENYIWEE